MSPAARLAGLAGRLRGTPASHRIVLGGTVALSVGRGMYAAASVVYFTRWLGLSAGQVGVALSVAGAMSLLAAVPLGALADRTGARRAVIWLQLAQATLIGCLLFVHSFATLLAVVALLGASDRGNQVARQALVSDLAAPAERVRLQAYIRTVFNVSVSAGVAAAAPVIAAGTRGPFVFLILGVVVCYALVAATTSRLPPTVSGHARTTGPRPGRPGAGLIALGLVSGFLALHVSILEVGVPLWILHETSAPRSLIAVLILVNTVLAALFQVVASRRANSVRGAALTLTVSAAATGGSCVLFAVTHGRGAWIVAAVLLAATALLTAGELLQSAAAWGLAYGLSPDRAMGSHLGAFSMGAALQDVLGPGLVAFVIVYSPPRGWLVLTAAFACCGALVLPLTAWAQRGRDSGEPGPEPAAASGSVTGGG
jgi:MFS transporter